MAFFSFTISRSVNSSNYRTSNKSKAPSIDSVSLNNYNWQDSMKRVYGQNMSNLNPRSSIYSSTSSLNSTNVTTPTTLNGNSHVNKANKFDSSNESAYSFAGVHHIFNNHKGAVTRIRFANNDKSLLASCSLDGTLVICQVIPSPATTVNEILF